MIRISCAAAAAAMIVAGMTFTAPALAQQQSDRLGSVQFGTSCNEDAQRRFNRGLRYQHSFWYQQSKEIFEDVLKADPGCAIAYWGIALALQYNPHSPPPAENLPLGLAAVRKGQGVGAKTARERDYIDAMSVFYTDYDKIDHRTRVQAYLKKMEALAQKYPQDDEAQIFYAITLNVAAPPNDKTYALQLKGAAILEPISRRLPNHPGAVHYLIHLYDYPAIANKGLDAAKRYAGIAPAAPHAQHMPSHIFTRVGFWKESIASNAESARVAKLDKQWDDQMHGMDYLVYAYLQLGQDKNARTVIEEMSELKGYSRFSGFYAMAASPARYMVERSDWKGAAGLQIRPTKLAYADAITYFARALGAARSGNPEAAKADVAKLAELRDSLRAAKDAYWPDIVDIQRQVAAAWVLYAEGKHDDALAAMSAAADAEDKTEKHPVTPGPLAPARELYGTMLLERAKAGEALAAFEATLAKEPNRLGATLGAAKAADKAGNAAKAKDYYAKAVALGADADPVRKEIADARAYLAGTR